MTQPDDAHRPIFEDEPIDLSDLRWDDTIVLVAFWALAVVVFLQFFTRYVLNDSYGWTEEVARYLLIAVTFTGAVMAVRKESQIAVEFLYRWVPRPLRRVMQIVVDLTCLAFYGALTWFSVVLAHSTRQKMASVKLPKSVIYWGVAACFAAMTLYALIVLIRHLRSGSGRLVDPEAYAATVQIE